MFDPSNPRNKERTPADSAPDDPRSGEASRYADRLRSVVDSADQGIFVLDERGRCTLFNRAASMMTGWPAEEVLGKDVHRLIHHSRPNRTPCLPNACPILSVLRTGTGVRLNEDVLWRRDGSAFPAEYSSYPMIEDGTIIGAVATFNDVTQRKEARESYRATLNMLEDFDEEKAKLQKLQQATLNILEDFDEERRNLQRVQKATLNLLEDMNEEREKSSETQRALMNILEDVEVERSRAEQSKVMVEAVNRELEAFSYSVSHDLRAPLRAISGFAQAVVEDYAPGLDDEGRRFLALIQDNAHNMGRLIDDLLTFSRLGRQEMVRTQIDIEALIESVFHELIAQSPEAHVRLSIHAAPPAYGDQAMIRQVAVNLLSNAMKFTRKKSDPTIEFGHIRNLHEGSYYVKDNGVGFDMKYSGKLFGVFQRLHSVDEFEGTGVGLALVYRIITRHGGRIWAEGEPDQGATFYFTLPPHSGGHNENRF